MLATPLRPRVFAVRHRRGVRLLTALDPATRQSYARLVGEAAASIERSLSPSVAANRLDLEQPPAGELRLRPWRLERREFARGLARLVGGDASLAVADVRRCFPSISPQVVAHTLSRMEITAAGEIEDLLLELETAGVRGLPIGPDASAVLANAVLSHADRALEAERIPFLRWVDDVVMRVEGPRGARVALDVLRSVWGELGLRPNEQKTRVVEGTRARALLAPSGAEAAARVG